MTDSVPPVFERIEAKIDALAKEVADALAPYRPGGLPFGIGWTIPGSAGGEGGVAGAYGAAGGGGGGGAPFGGAGGRGGDAVTNVSVLEEPKEFISWLRQENAELATALEQATSSEETGGILRRVAVFIRSTAMAVPPEVVASLVVKGLPTP
jgi:hypothetical protein